VLRLGHKTLEIPLIQGGMGIAISLSGLAGAVMKEGGMGVISAAQPGFRMEGFDRDPAGKNLEAIAREAEKARTIAGSRGLLGLNIMHAGTHYAQYCRQAEASGYDAILSGAGLALELPAYVSDDILLAPIVSSLRALQLIVKKDTAGCRISLWWKEARQADTLVFPEKCWIRDPVPTCPA
jgi:NAD(P)H-dependent flavin oxidoreductase YrpB (nitropropane dioxygenase family)